MPSHFSKAEQVQALLLSIRFHRSALPLTGSLLAAIALDKIELTYQAFGGKVLINSPH
ncbi:MAG: hypothetical protein KME30_28495 [Iphinoe sp. HA4291-MV1]|nr:hypothetical protein [Iphinoe sp. HA4291-MV1]